MTSQFPPHNPLQVLLRCGAPASVWTYPPDRVSPQFPLLGIVNGELHAWTMTGSWAYDGAEHPFDITHLVTASGLAEFKKFPGV